MICEQLVQSADVYTSIMFDAFFMLAKIHFLNGYMSYAKHHCQKSRSAALHVADTANGSSKATALMSAILAFEGDEIKAAAYTRLLSNEFQIPSFQTPHVVSPYSRAKASMSKCIAAGVSGIPHSETRNFVKYHGMELDSPESASSGPTAMLWAAHDGRIDALSLLLSRSVPINHLLDLEERPLSTPGKVRRSLPQRRQSEQINAFNRGITPLHAACGNAQPLTAQLLLQEGANIHAFAKNDHKPAAIHYASRSGDATIVDMLLSHGADPNALRADNITALMDAAATDHLDAMRVLVSSGAIPNTTDHLGRHALAHACAGKASLDTVAFLLRHRLPTTSRDSHARALLHFVASRNNWHLIELLVQHGANTEVINDAGHRPIHIAGWLGHYDTIDQLVDNGAKLEARTRYGDTALHLAAHQNHIEAVRLLISKGADLSAPGKDKKMAEALASGDVARLLKFTRLQQGKH